MEKPDPGQPNPPLSDTEAAQAIEQHATHARLKQCRVHSQRALTWFVAMLVSLLLGGTLAIPAVAKSAWDTWLINWQSNLMLCFAGLCLVMSLGHSARLVYLAFSAKTH